MTLCSILSYCHSNILTLQKCSALLHLLALFDKIPDTTNAVESPNRCSKGSSPDILKVALMSTYKIDMVAALEHLAKSKGIATGYEDMSIASRATRTKVSNKARYKKRATSDDAEGPPDKHQDFKKGLLIITPQSEWKA